LTIRHIFFLETEVDDSLLFTRAAEGLETGCKEVREVERDVADLVIYRIRSRFNSDPCKHSWPTLRKFWGIANPRKAKVYGR
jgi:hypothetical protein